jgi:hypothetical protein
LSAAKIFPQPSRSAPERLRPFHPREELLPIAHVGKRRLE